MAKHEERIGAELISDSKGGAAVPNSTSVTPCGMAQSLQLIRLSVPLTHQDV